MKNTHHKSESEILRQKAEELLKLKPSGLGSPISETDMLKLIHELEVHQVELEMQNVELIEAKKQADVAAEKYTELFDFAPTGYFTLSKEGMILELNIFGSQILGKERATLKNRQFDLFVSSETKPVFNLFLDKVFNSKTKESCELTLWTKDNFPTFIHLTGIIAENGEQCHITVINITERKQAENAIRESENKYRSLIELTGMGYLILDRQGIVVDANQEYVRLTGHHELREILGRNIVEWTAKHAQQRNTEAVAQCFKDGHIRDFVTEYEDVNGLITHVEINATLEGEGESVRIISLCHDISDRKQIEDALRESEENFRSIFENNSTAIAIIETDTTISMVNEEYCKVSGYTKQEVIGKSWTHQIPPQDRERLKEYNRQRLINPKDAPDKYEFTFYKNNGEIRHCLMSITMLSNRKIIASFVDITERKRDEERIRYQANLLENVSDAIIATDMLYNIQYWNPTAEKQYGWTASEVIGQPLEKFIINDYLGYSLDIILQKISQDGYWKGEVTQNHRDGTHISIISTVSLITNEANQTTGFIAVNHDITDRKQAEQELITAKEQAEESDHLKSAFLANMSHEIRTPMNGILGFAQLLKEPDLTGQEQQDYIRIIEKSGKRMLNIINDIVDISKIESGLMDISISESNINEQIEFIYHFFTPEVEKKRIQLSFKNTLPSKESIIKTDREKIYAILTNLVKNAIKYTNEGSIEFGYDMVKTQHVAALQFYVTDTGIGIPKERQEAIFERFIQADISDTQAFEGAGLGLSIAKAYVEMLGGKIWVESEEGKGSTFYFTIPYNCEPEGKMVIDDIASAVGVDNQIKNLKILIAEDEEASDFLITSILKTNNHEILHAKTGIETVDACRNNLDIDLVLMDIRMPNTNGFEATRQIRQFNKDVIIIAQTAYGLSGDRKKAIDTGCNDYLSKPIDKDELLGLIQKYFKK